MPNHNAMPNQEDAYKDLVYEIGLKCKVGTFVKNHSLKHERLMFATRTGTSAKAHVPGSYVPKYEVNPVP